MFRTRCTTGGRGRARSCAAVVAGATLLASTAAGVVGTAAVAGAAPVTSGAAPVTLTVPTAHGHGARHGAVPRWTA